MLGPCTFSAGFPKILISATETFFSSLPDKLFGIENEKFTYLLNTIFSLLLLRVIVSVTSVRFSFASALELGPFAPTVLTV